MTEIFVWPDGTWCEREDLEDFLAFMSDDYRRVTDLVEIFEITGE